MTDQYDIELTPQEQIDELQGYMDIAMGGMVSAMVSLSKQEEYFDAMATCYKKSYDSLKKAGFSAQGAMSLLKVQNFSGNKG